MTQCFLAAGGHYRQRQAAIAARLDPHIASAVIFEGVDPEAGTAGVPGFFPAPSSTLITVSIAIGCPCCDGGLVMRVTLDRMLQRHPEQLYISLAHPAHLPHLQAYLETPPYKARVTLAPVLDCDHEVPAKT